MSLKMIKLLVALVLIAALGWGANYFFSGKPKAINETSATEENGYHFYYYPKLNIYYDVSQNNFVYSVDGGHSWQTKKPTSDQIPENISDKVSFYSPVPETWHNNEEHRKAFKGVLVNYVEKPEDTATIKIDTTTKKKKAVVKKKEDPEEKVEEKKKGFFKRLKEKLKKKPKEEATNS
jgi:hypothetical protein